MDTAKAVNVLLTNPPISQHYVGLGAEMKPGKPLVCSHNRRNRQRNDSDRVVPNTASNTKMGKPCCHWDAGYCRS